MIKHHEPMRWRVFVFVVFVLACGCTERNKKFCGDDGVCADPAFPFCDVGGEVAGTPDTCVAVDCTPGMFETCRGDSAITCNSVGGDFDLIPCELGCDAATGGCRQCAADTDCANPTPVCETAMNSCRGCAVDDECASRVCDRATGECALESEVVYVHPVGAGDCSLTTPCRLDTGVAGAVAAGGLPIVRMLPGTYSTNIDVSATTAQPIKIVATGARISTALDEPAIRLDEGANVEVRGLEIVNPKAIACSGTTLFPSLSFSEGSIFAVGNGANLIDIGHGSASIVAADLQFNGNEIPIRLHSSGNLSLDRVRAHGTNSHHLIADGQLVNITAINSLFEDLGFDMNTTDPSPISGSKLTVESSTMVYTIDTFLSQGCEATPNLSVLYENSIIAPLQAFDAVQGTSCKFVNTILSRQAVPPSGTTVADPRFVNPGGKDFHLTTTSPAVDAAAPSTIGLDSVIDLDGTPRPQGTTSDVGCYELGL